MRFFAFSAQIHWLSIHSIELNSGNEKSFAICANPFINESFSRFVVITHQIFWMWVFFRAKCTMVMECFFSVAYSDIKVSIFSVNLTGSCLFVSFRSNLCLKSQRKSLVLYRLCNLRLQNVHTPIYKLIISCCCV